MSPPGGQSSALGTLLSFAFAQSCRGSCGPGGDARYQSPSPPDSAKHFRSKTCLTFLENSPGWRPVLPPEQPYRRAGQVGPSRLQGQRALSHRRMGPTPSRSQVTSRHSPGTFCLFILLHRVLSARILQWVALPSSSGPSFVRTLHCDPSVLGGPAWHGS